jgi:hypothetical protein
VVAGARHRAAVDPDPERDLCAVTGRLLPGPPGAEQCRAGHAAAGQPARPERHPDRVADPDPFAPAQPDAHADHLEALAPAVADVSHAHARFDVEPRSGAGGDVNRSDLVVVAVRTPVGAPVRAGTDAEHVRIDELTGRATRAG